MTEEKIPTRDLAILTVVLAVSWILAQIVVSIIFPFSWLPFSPVLMFTGITWVSVMMGFMIYRQRLRDERTIHVSDKAARNGFTFVLYVIPIAIVGLTGIGASSDAIIAVVLIWFGAVVVAGMSAFYYYRK
ncbi:MAG: hypothetical protein ACTSPB_11860 [Candidatus Thorarchaeota archaeon]